MLSISILARLPLPVRRRALRMFWLVMRAANRLPSMQIETTIRYALRVSRKEAMRLEREVVFHDWLSGLEWTAATLRTKPQATRDSRAILMDSPDTLESLAASGRPIIFAPLHMGCFPWAFAAMIHRHFSNRRMLILRAREDRLRDTAAMKRVAEIGVDMKFLNVANKQEFADAVRFAREGAIIVAFLDLPASYGSPASISLFGYPARLAVGVGALARLAGAMIVPVAVTSSVDGDVMTIGRPFESNDTGESEKARIADIFKRHIERSVRSAPEQWQMWQRFNEFIDQSQYREVA